jgi:serpin B
MGTDLRNVVAGNNQFALDLYLRLRADSPDNLFFSPSSLSIALAMTYAGARGETAEQMAAVLRLRLPQEKLHQTFAELRGTWDAEGQERGYRLSAANRLWGQAGYEFLSDFLTVTREHYGAEPTQVDFAEPNELARKRINAWVEEQTQGTIRDLIPGGVLNALTRLVLTNAIYFKGDWTQPFRKKATKKAPFHISAREQVEVRLMEQESDFRYWAGDGLKVLELPYGNGELAMLVFLPDDIEGLSALEARLTTDNLSRWLSDLRWQKVRVYLPRLTLTSHFDLCEALAAMGMPQAFTDDADFSGMSPEKGLYIEAVIHKAFVDVNKEGTEAAAASAVVMECRGRLRGPAVFRADHPFLFLIRDNRTGGILFLGRLMKPQG